MSTDPTLEQLLDAAFSELQHDTGPQDVEYQHQRASLKKAFSTILNRLRALPREQPDARERIYTKADVEALIAAALAAKQMRTNAVERLEEFNRETDRAIAAISQSSEQVVGDDVIAGLHSVNAYLACDANYDDYAKHTPKINAAITALDTSRERGEVRPESHYERTAYCLMEMMKAYERRIRSDCKTQEDLDKRPWECSEYLAAADVLKRTWTQPRAPAAAPVEMERDAKRYRWLRANCRWGPESQHRLQWYLPYGICGSGAEQLDANLDQAIAAADRGE